MWYPIPDFPKYQIDPDTQEVLGSKGRILKRRPDKRGRIWIALYRDGKQYNLKLAHLMLITFDRRPKPGEVTRHRDDNPGNNALDNLCWGTQSENMHDKVRNGLHWNANKTECINGHPFDEVNTYVHPRTGKRTCRACVRDSMRRRRAASRAVGALVITMNDNQEENHDRCHQPPPRARVPRHRGLLAHRARPDA